MNDIVLAKPAPSLAHDERGSAPLEFIGAGLLLLVPLVYLIVALGAVQQQTLGSESAARHMARLLASEGVPSDHADRVWAAIIDDYGIDSDAVTVSVECTPAGSGCPAPGTLATVTVTTQVALPLMPTFLGLDEWARVPVEASAVQRISRTWGAE